MFHFLNKLTDFDGSFYALRNRWTFTSVGWFHCQLMPYVWGSKRT